MTNEQIIMEESIKLAKEGVLKTFNVDGLEVPEPIHTFKGWKSRGYKVKKGEKSKIKFPVWKYSKKTIEKDGEEKEKSSMYLNLSSFFTSEQVEKA